MQELKRKAMRMLRWITVGIQWLTDGAWWYLKRHWHALLVGMVVMWWIAPAEAATAEIGVLHNTYNAGRLDIDEPSGHLKASYKSVYVWVSYENPNVRLVGQRMGDIELIGFGVGLQRSYGDFRPFLELGYFDPDASTKSVIRDEAVVTELNNNHGWRGNRHFKTTEYNVDAVYGGRVGVLFDVNEYLAVGASYRFLQLDEQLQAYTGDCDWPPTKACKSWWVENRKLDVSSVQVGVYGRF